MKCVMSQHFSGDVYLEYSQLGDFMLLQGGGMSKRVILQGGGTRGFAGV